MRFAICNELFGEMPFDEAFRLARSCGYEGVEWAPFTLRPHDQPFDVAQVTPQQRAQARQAAQDAGLETTGLHWLLAKTEGCYLTSPDTDVQKRTTNYLAELARLCTDLGGRVLVLGSPQQRNLLPGVSHEEAMDHAAAVIRASMPVYEELEVTLALEPLAPAEGDFLNTAEFGVELLRKVDSPCCRLHLDTKAMSSEAKPIPQIIRDCREHLAYFHANDPNLLGPGMGQLDFAPIFAALREVGYDGWVSVEVFDYSPGPERIARESIEYLKQIA